MQAAWMAFYRDAASIGCHAFLEFSGLMAKFIDLCRQAEASGEPWLRANVHSGQHLAFEGHDVDYLLEKLECIYGMHFRLDQRVPAVPPADPRRRARAAAR